MFVQLFKSMDFRLLMLYGYYAMKVVFILDILMIPVIVILIAKLLHKCYKEGTL